MYIYIHTYIDIDTDVDTDIDIHALIHIKYTCIFEHMRFGEDLRGYF